MSEALGFIGIYACYALTVFFDRQLAGFLCSKFGGDTQIGIDDFYGVEIVSSPLSSEKSASSLDYSTGSSPRDMSQFLKPEAYDVFRIPDYHTRDANYDSDNSSHGAQPPLQRKTSAPTPRSKRLEEPETVRIGRARNLYVLVACFKSLILGYLCADRTICADWCCTKRTNGNLCWSEQTRI